MLVSIKSQIRLTVSGLNVYLKEDLLVKYGFKRFANLRHGYIFIFMCFFIFFLLGSVFNGVSVSEKKCHSLKNTDIF